MTMRISWLDRVLIGIAPRWGLGRIRARAAAATVIRHYDAAATGRRTSGWKRYASDPNAAGGPAITKLRELSRDLRRNNGWARRAIQVIANNTVGWGIQAKAIGAEESLLGEAADLWSQWSGDVRSDYDGRLPFGGIQRMAIEAIVESGEVLVVKEPATTVDGLEVPTRIRALEADYLDTFKDGVNGESGPIIQGIELDGRGRRVAYWLHDHHPGSFRLFGKRFGSRRIPADRVLHVYQVERPGQMRGVPWLANAVARLHDYDEYEDAILLQQKIAACFGAFVQDLDGDSSLIGNQDADDAAASPELEEMEPGRINYLSPGRTVTFATPPVVQDSSFSANNLRRIAVGVGVTYEDMTGDFSQVNYSSARMARLAHFANVESWRWLLLIPQLNDQVWRWIMADAAALEGWPVAPRAEWSPPAMPSVDPVKEGLANLRQIRGGTKTLYQAIREQGEDPQSMLAEIAAGNRRLDELGIVLDSDPRRTSAQGQAQEDGADAGSDDADDSGANGSDRHLPI